MPIFRLAPNEAMARGPIVLAVTRPSGTTTVSPHRSRSSSVALLLPGFGSVSPDGTATVAVFRTAVGVGVTVAETV